MLVDFDQTLTATEVFNLGRFGEVGLSGAGRLYTPTAVAAPGAAGDRPGSTRTTAAGSSSTTATTSRTSTRPATRQGGLSATQHAARRRHAAGPDRRAGLPLRRTTGSSRSGRSAFDRDQPAHRRPRRPSAATSRSPRSTSSTSSTANGLGGGFPTAARREHAVRARSPAGEEVSALTAINADIVGLMEIENDATPNSAIEELVGGAQRGRRRRHLRVHRHRRRSAPTRSGSR